MRGNSDPAPALFLGFLAGLWFFFKGFRVMREYKVLEDTPRMPIRSVPMGFVHIRGKAEGAQLLTSPLSQTPCCFYKVDVDQWKSQGKSHNWVRVCTDFNGYQFHLADDTGKILIDAHSADYDLPMTASHVVDSQTAANTVDAKLLEYVRFAETHSMTERMGQWVDKRLAKGAENPQVQEKREAFRQLFAGIATAREGGKLPVAAMQKLFESTGPLSDPEKEQHRQMMLQNQKLAEAANESGLLQQMMNRESPASGRFRLQEYVVTPGQEYLISGTCVENSDPACAPGDRSMIAKGQNEPTFLISTKTDAQVHRAFEKRSLLMIFGGAAAAIGCAVGLLMRYGLF